MTTTDTRTPSPAEEAKFLAEAEKAKAEAEAALITARAEATKSQAEATRADEEAEQFRLESRKMRHDADREDEKRERELTADHRHHTYHFKSAVSDTTVEQCVAQLNFWERTEDPGEITVVFYSPGGSVLAGMALFDHITALREKGWHFTTVVRGYAASMSGILLQAGDVRRCGPESYLLIHEVSSGAVGKIGDLEDEVEFVKRIQERVLAIFVNRSGGKVTKAKLRSMYRRKDLWLDSDQCLKLGLIDEIG